jgi:CheY-like chemotaxis protein
MSARVLVVNDDGELTRSIQTLLREEGYETLGVSDGEAALEVLSGWPADLVVLDLRMPRLDGWTFLKLQDERNLPAANVRRPIVLVFSAVVAEGLERARELGATECLSAGSTSPTLLLATIARLLAQQPPLLD